MNKKGIITTIVIMVVLGLIIAWAFFQIVDTYKTNKGYQNMIIAGDTASLIGAMYNAPGDVDLEYQNEFLKEKILNTEGSKIRVGDLGAYGVTGILFDAKEFPFFGVKDQEINIATLSGEKRYFSKFMGQIFLSSNKKLQEYIKKQCSSIATKSSLNNLVITISASEADAELGDFAKSFSELANAKFEEEPNQYDSLLIFKRTSGTTTIYSGSDEKSEKLKCIIEQKLSGSSVLSKSSNELGPEKKFFAADKIIVLIEINNKLLNQNTLKNIQGAVNEFNK